MDEQKENVTVTENESDIVKMINDVKAESEKNRALYEKSEKEKAELAKALLNNDYSNNSQPEVFRNSKDIAEDFFKAARNDERRKGFELALEYREARLRESGVDPFVNNNPNTPPSAADYMEADRYAEVYKQIIDNTDDEAGFNLEYNRIFNDIKK